MGLKWAEGWGGSGKYFALGDDWSEYEREGGAVYRG